MLIDKHSLPNLSSLMEKKAIATFLVHQLVGADEDFPPQMASFRRNFVRLADKVVRDYIRLYELVEKQIAEPMRSTTEMERDGRFIYVHLISDALEDCLITLCRLFRYFERIRTDESGFIVDRTFRRQVQSLQKAIVDMRGSVEHLDEDIVKGRMPTDALTAPVFNKDASEISLGEHRLLSSDLAKTVRLFHQFAHEFATYRVGISGDYEQFENPK